MTNNDAIYYLQYLRHDVKADSQLDIALVTAINALSANTEFTPSSMAHYPEPIEQKKTTNADRIRAMTDAELDEFLNAITDSCNNNSDADCESCPMYYKTKYCNCDIARWLKQEAKDSEVLPDH